MGIIESVVIAQALRARELDECAEEIKKLTSRKMAVVNQLEMMAVGIAADFANNKCAEATQHNMKILGGEIKDIERQVAVVRKKIKKSKAPKAGRGMARGAVSEACGQGQSTVH